jgi:flagellar biosynthesis protein FlhA
MSVMTLDTQLEQILQGAIQGSPGGLEPSLMERTINEIIEASGRIEADGKTPVMLVASSIRLFLSRLLRTRMASFYILAYEEIPASKTIKVVATIGGSQV